MGGGAAVRAAAKAAGIGVFNAGIRGGGSGFASVVPPAEKSVRTASRPVTAVLSASASSGGVEVEPVQLPVLDLADWELAGGAEEERMLIDHRPEPEPLPRVVFGGPPTIEEARSATNDLKDALEKVFLKSSACKEPCHVVGGSFVGMAPLPGLSLLSDPEKLDSCVPSEPKVPEHAVKAFTLFNQSPGAQSVVASIVSDANVWDAVMQNPALVEFLQSQKTFVADSEVSDNESFPESPKKVTKLSSDEASDKASEDGNKVDLIERIKCAVVKMVNNVTDFFQNIFGPSSVVNQNAKVPSMDMTLGASLTGLAVMVIMLVVLKRG